MAESAPRLDLEEIKNVKHKDSQVPVDGVVLVVRTWVVPDTVKRKAVIIYNHGFSEYLELYNQYHPFLAKAGYEVIIYDQRGAGKTSPGDLYALTNEQHVFNDLDRLIEITTKQYTDLPLFMMGHSMGGGITLSYGVKGTYRDLFCGYLAYAPLVGLALKTQPSKLVMYGLSWLAYLAPNFRRSPGLKPSNLTHNPEWEAVLLKDREKRVICSASQMHDMLARGQKLMDKSYVADFVHDKSLAIFHSTTDEINDHGASKTFFTLFQETHSNEKGVKKFYTYDNMHHCMPQETLDRQYTLVHDTLEFLDAAIA